MRTVMVTSLVDQAEARAPRDDVRRRSISSARAGQQQMHGRVEAEVLEAGRHVVHLAVADEDGAGDARVAGTSARARASAVEQAGAAARRRSVLVGAGAHRRAARHGERAGCASRLRRARSRSARGAVADVLAGADRRPRPPRRRRCSCAPRARPRDWQMAPMRPISRQRPPGGAARAPPQAEQQHQQRQRSRSRQRSAARARPARTRSAGCRSIFYCPSRSRMSRHVHLVGLVVAGAAHTSRG